jgi:hypothetical protein
MPRIRNARPSEAFLSHSSRNAAFVNRLARVLTAHEISHFLSQKSIRGAQQWHDEIGAALHRCDWFLLVLSPESVSSKWVKYELVYALQQKRQYRNRIVPLLYKNCDKDKLSWTLSSIQLGADFRKSFHEGARELLSIWNIRYRSKR